MPTVPALARGLDILELFLERPCSLSVPEIAARLGLPRSTAHQLVQTLVARGYLTPLDGQPHRFRLGLRAFELGGAYSAHLDLAREGQEVAQSVASRCGETVYIATLDGTEVVYIAKVDSIHPVRLIASVGMRLPAHCTGLGKMLLAGRSDEELAALYPSEELPGMTATSITSFSELRGVLAENRAKGLAFDNAESTPGVQCVAAPIFNRDGAMVAALSIATPAMRMSPGRQVVLAELVQAGARELSRRLGYVPVG